MCNILSFAPQLGRSRHGFDFDRPVVEEGCFILNCGRSHITVVVVVVVVDFVVKSISHTSLAFLDT